MRRKRLWTAAKGLLITEPESMRELAEDVKRRRCETAKLSNGREEPDSLPNPRPSVIAFLVGRQAKAEVDETWSYIATESGNVDIADRMVDEILQAFFKYQSIRTSVAGDSISARASAALWLGSMSPSPSMAWRGVIFEYSR
jgi:hypothetical protein